MTESFDCIIVGGGITGLGIARDCCMRGLKVLLIERYDIAAGATGSNHGLLHSGARYAVTDPESARECIGENHILRFIAKHCVEDTGGLFLTLPEDGLDFQEKFIEACTAAGIPTRHLSRKEALRREHSANPEMLSAVEVPDAAVDPFRLSVANMLDAKEYGAEILTYSEVIDVIREQDRVVGVKVRSHKTGLETSYYADVVINAVGIWGQKIARMAGVDVMMQPNKGAMLVYGERANKMVLNRCRKPGNADILVPSETVTLIGTTSKNISFDEVDKLSVSADEVRALIDEGEKLCPSLASTRILRAYAGVRPLVVDGQDSEGRNISRGIALFDHAERDGLQGYVTITGGKMMTYRLMAEWTTDLVCKKLNVDAKCRTAEVALPGSREDRKQVSKKIFVFPSALRKSLVHRYGERAIPVLSYILSMFRGKRLAAHRAEAYSLLCECERVTAGEILYAKKELNIATLMDLRRRTRVGMGQCQGEICICRAAGLLGCRKEEVVGFLQERWKGVMPVAFGDSIAESEYTSRVYRGLCGFEQK
ncbi:MAG: anaerobic glycerol-3-phosphate dehydrogenase subunit A [Bacteroidales bacterium]|jgi:glycerol-3-phosphate dehydrogenase|nr:anaerobic glycerol-3-phosphate dehydrogenase subunit A [Bacteroidales bacterium]